MDQATALARLKRMVAWNTEPQLSESDLTELLSMVQIVDENGREPNGSGWQPTYNLNLAAAEGWRWKAAKAISMYDFSADGGRYDRSQVIRHCQEMAAQYARKVASDARVTSVIAGSRSDWIINLAEEST